MLKSKIIGINNIQSWVALKEECLPADFLIVMFCELAAGLQQVLLFVSTV